MRRTLGLVMAIGVWIVPVVAQANNHCIVNGEAALAAGIPTLGKTALNDTRCIQRDARSDGTNNRPGFDPFRKNATTGLPQGLVSPDTINVFITLGQSHGAVTNDPFGRILDFDPATPGIQTDLGTFFDPCVQGQIVPFLTSVYDAGGRLVCGPALLASFAPGADRASSQDPFDDAPEEHIALGTVALGSYHEDFKDAFVWNAGATTSRAIPRLLHGTTPIPGTPSDCLASQTCVVEYVEIGIPSTPADHLNTTLLETFKMTAAMRTKNQISNALISNTDITCDNSAFFDLRTTCRPVIKWSLYEKDFDGNTFNYGGTFVYCEGATNLGSFETTKPCFTFPTVSYPSGETQDSAVLGITVDPRACLAPPGQDCSKP